MKILFYTTFALVGFAFNSILCRLALGTASIDAASFTAVRLVSGAITLYIISLFFGKNGAQTKKGNWLSAFFLFAYAICFSFAYNGLTTATGALILFGCVQFTMIASALRAEEKPKFLEWAGFLSALAGLIYLVFPGLSSPPIFHSLLMALAGVSWGFYTLRGRASENPLADTTGNFIRAVPMILLLSLPFLPQIHISGSGFWLAILSGSIASGLGYSFWYAALKFHTRTRAATLQLSVPLLAAIGGIVFLSEIVSLRLLLAGILILGGIGLTISSKMKN